MADYPVSLAVPGSDDEIVLTDYMVQRPIAGTSLASSLTAPRSGA